MGSLSAAMRIGGKAISCDPTLIEVMSNWIGGAGLPVNVNVDNIRFDCGIPCSLVRSRNSAVDHSSWGRAKNVRNYKCFLREQQPVLYVRCYDVESSQISQFFY